MIGSHFSVILLPTNKCNVACEYCFEDKTDDFMSLEQLSVVIEKLLDHMERKAIAALTIYWQGERSCSCRRAGLSVRANSSTKRRP